MHDEEELQSERKSSEYPIWVQGCDQDSSSVVVSETSETAVGQLPFLTRFAERLSTVATKQGVPGRSWDLLWSLLAVDPLRLDGDLRLLVDQGAVCTEVFRALWEARFKLVEGGAVDSFMRAFIQWLQGGEPSSDEQTLLVPISSSYERFDALFFLATLASQNDLLDPLRLDFDGPITPKEKADLCLMANRWYRIGSPLGFAVCVQAVQ